MENERILAALKRLKKLKEEGPVRLTTGICGYMEEEIGHSVLISLSPAWVKWPLYSGSREFPIAVQGIEPSHLYLTRKRARTLWDEDTEYGRARWALVDFLIEYFEKKDQNETVSQ